MRKIALILAVCAAAAFAAPASAWAYDCDTKVVDEAGKLTSDDASNVNLAIQNLENQGAEVRVRTLVDFGGSGYANLDAYEHAVMQSCPSWQAANGHTKNNLVVFMLSYNAGDKIKAGLYYGDEWVSQIKGQWPSLLSQGVGPMVRAGRHGDAVARALNGIAGFIKPAEAARQPNAAPAPAQPSVVIDNRKPTNLVGLWYVLGGLVLFGIGIALFLLLRSRKREREAAQVQQQDAQAVKASCGSKIVEYDDASMAILESTVNTAAESASEEDANELRARLAAFTQKVATATTEFAELQQSKNDPSFNDYGAESYRRIAASYRSILGMLHEADNLKTAVDDAVKAQQRVAAQAPDKIAKAKQAAAAAHAQVKSTKDGGYKFPETFAKRLTQEASDMDAAIVAAEASLAAKRHGAAIASAAKAEQAAVILTASSQEMPSRRAAAEKSAAELKAGIVAAETSITEAQATLAATEKAYAPSNWTDVKDHIEAANAQIVIARMASVQADAAATMEKQDWDVTKSNVDTGKKALNRVATLTGAIRTLKTTLENAQRQASGEVESTRQGITKARAYLKDKASDVQPGHASELDAAEKSLNVAAGMLKEPQPDFLKTMQAIKASATATDTVLTAAKSEYEAMERKRQKAASSLVAAQTAVKTAAQFIETHTGDVGVRARTTLDTARQQVANVRSDANLDAIAARADAAKQTAETSLKEAEADYKRAEGVRQEAARIAREQELARQREIERQEQYAREQAYARQRELDSIAEIAAATAAAELAAASNRRDTSNDFPSFGGGGGGGGYTGGGNSDGGGGSISIDTTPSDDGGGGSVGFDSSPSSDGGGGSTDI